MRWWRAGLLGMLGLIAWPAVALAQQYSPVTTAPFPTTSAGLNASNVITTNVFTLVFAAISGIPGTTNRKGCTITNNGGHNMFVTEGLGGGGSTQGKASLLLPGQSWYCGVNGVALQGEVDIAGTVGDGYYAAQY